LRHEPRGAISAAWIRDRHLTRRRTVGEMAAELGESDWRIRHWVHKHGIPLQTYVRRGPDRDALNIARQLDVDALLLPALTKFGWRRLQRFAAIAGYPNIGNAARAIGCRPDTLRRQVQLLERDFGRRLIERAPSRTKPTRLTAFGVEVTNAARRVERQLGLAAARRRPAQTT